MGRRGPRPIPDSVLSARGSTWHLRRGGGAPLVQLPAEAPGPPADFPQEAREEWDAVVPALVDAGVLARVDRPVLEAYCRCWAAFRELERQVRKEGWCAEDGKGNQVRTAASRALESMLDRSMKLARELGLTPTSRVGLRQLQRPERPGRPGARSRDDDDDRYGLREGPRV